jgi:hypothetical protein
MVASAGTAEIFTPPGTELTKVPGAGENVGTASACRGGPASGGGVVIVGVGIGVGIVVGTGVVVVAVVVGTGVVPPPPPPSSLLQAATP